MFRGTSARTVVLFLAAALIILPFFAPTTPFASAHTSRDAVGHAQPGTTLTGLAPHDETVTCHTPGRSGNPHGPARVRDRHRTATAPQSEAPERPLLRQHAPAVPEPASSGRAAGHRARAVPDHSPAALQVFRC
ncbi:hypothetical protein [Streptomyces lancefieldiae]|uniref:Secreted protein n=1 Tax=Streptomyces lancefieldiae TaxID=3075520 RepID=A0ABU3APP0_9ACTN|nr:hypothetical protein [Streptomyces sp. DSM 40712]MDT0611552.1 hypothetical protein [Streptomyces sp. DSM 40712]